MTVGISARDEQRYWRRNVALVLKLLVIWFAVSFGAGILLVEPLNQIQIGGYKLGFWFAQQGSIYAFVVLIFVYGWRMRALDREFGIDHAEDKNAGEPAEQGGQCRVPHLFVAVRCERLEQL